VNDVRPLHVIAREIAADWERPYFGAIPYIEAMAFLTTMESHYGHDAAADIVTRFLVNAGNWRGGTARRIKTELREMSRKGIRK
jgi:hypothetical protein